MKDYALRPRNRSFSITVPAAAITAQRKEWIERIQGQVRQGWNAMREQIFAKKRDSVSFQTELLLAQ